MSNRLLNLVFGVHCFGPSRSGPARRMVMVSLADRVCGEDADTCYPGVPDIAARTELGVSTVRRILAGLKAEGWLASTQRPGYGNVFRLNVEKLQASQREPRSLCRSSRITKPEFSDAAKEEPASAVSPPVAGGETSTVSPPVNAFLNRKNPENPSSAAERSGSRSAAEGNGNALRKKPDSGPTRDPRHTACRELILAMQKGLGVSYPWNAAFAGQLGGLLRSRPDLAVDEFGRWLRNLAASEDEWARKRTSKWLPSLQEYSRGPLDRHRRLEQALATSWGTTGSPRRKSAVEKMREVA